MSLSSGDGGPPHPYTKAASTARRIFDHQWKDFCNNIGQLRTHALQQMALLIDHLVGVRQQRRWHFEADRLCTLEIDHRLIFGRRLHRQRRLRYGPALA